MPELSDPVSQKIKDVSRFDLALIEAAFAGTSAPVIPQPVLEATEQENITTVAKDNRSTGSAAVKNTVLFAPPEKESQIAEMSIMNPVVTAAASEYTNYKAENASIVPATDLTQAAKDNWKTETIPVTRTASIAVMRKMINSTNTIKRANPQSAENVLADDLTPATQGTDKAEMAFVNHVATAATAEKADHKAENSSIISATDLTQAAKDNRETETLSINRESSIPVEQNMKQSSDTIKRVNLQSAGNLLTSDFTSTARAAKAEQADHETEAAHIGAGAESHPAANDRNGGKTVSLNHMVAPAAAEKAGHKMEVVFISRVADMLRQKSDNPATESTLNQARRTVITLQDYGQQTMSPKEMAAAVETQKPIPAPTGNIDSGAAIRQAASDRMESLELLHEAVTMKDAAATVADPANGNDRNRSVATISQAKSTGQAALFFRIDTSGLQPSSDAGKTASDGSTEINTQAIIDQIVEAKQAMGNDYGRVRIVLDPPNLGTVDLNIIVRRDRVSVVMTADNASIQQVLQSHGDNIRAAFQRQDLRIETFQVLLQDNGGSQQQFQGGAMYEQRREHQSKQSIPDGVPAIPVSPSFVETIPERGLVSVFV